MSFPTKPTSVHLAGLSGLGLVRFLAIIPHGKGSREIAIDVEPELLLRIADALSATAPVNGACPCDSKTGKYNHREAFLVGHAIWHVQNPDAPMPCVDMSSVIDVSTQLQIADLNNHEDQ